jgi:hypothetical protein
MDNEWVRLVGTGLLALLSDYKGPPRQVIEMYRERIQEIIDQHDDDQ